MIAKSERRAVVQRQKNTLLFLKNEEKQCAQFIINAIYRSKTVLYP